MSRLDLTAIKCRMLTEPENPVAKLLLAEVEKLYAEEDERRYLDLIQLLQERPFYLTGVEARLAAPHLTSGRYDKEEGICRLCRGERLVATDSGCFGPKYESCPNCDGRGVDKERMKLPDAARAQIGCECPTWWSADEQMQFVRDYDEKHVRAMAHMEQCPMRTRG